jgi:hypothetical protein
MRITNLHTGLFIAGGAVAYAASGNLQPAIATGCAAALAFICHYFQIVRKERAKERQALQSHIIDTITT